MPRTMQVPRMLQLVGDMKRLHRQKKRQQESMNPMNKHAPERRMRMKGSVGVGHI